MIRTVNGRTRRGIGAARTSRSKHEKGILVVGWARENNAVVGVDASCAGDQVFCAASKKYRLVLGVENDAAVSFMHDLKELLNKHVVDGELDIIGGDAANQGEIVVIDEILAFISSNLGHENTHINLEITPVISVNSSEGNEHPFIRALTDSLRDRVNVLIKDAKGKTDERAEP